MGGGSGGATQLAQVEVDQYAWPLPTLFFPTGLPLPNHPASGTREITSPLISQPIRRRPSLAAIIYLVEEERKTPEEVNARKKKRKSGPIQ